MPVYSPQSSVCIALVQSDPQTRRSNATKQFKQYLNENQKFFEFLISLLQLTQQLLNMKSI